MLLTDNYWVCDNWSEKVDFKLFIIENSDYNDCLVYLVSLVYADINCFC
jgi:hypothetical protein